MPKTLQEILDHADEISDSFEKYDYPDADQRPVEPLQRARRAVQDRAAAERDIAQAVADMRAAGYSWPLIGSVVGTSGEAVRQRYGKGSPEPAKRPARAAEVAADSPVAVSPEVFDAIQAARLPRGMAGLWTARVVEELERIRRQLGAPAELPAVVTEVWTALEVEQLDHIRQEAAAATELVQEEFRRIRQEAAGVPHKT